MSTSPDQLVRDFITLLSHRNIEQACELVTPDCEYDNVPIGKVYGPEGIRSVLDGFLGGCSDVDWSILRQVSTGDVAHATVINERNDRAMMHGSWFDLPVVGVFEIHDGRIALWRDYFDKETLFRAMTPPQ